MCQHIYDLDLSTYPWSGCVQHIHDLDVPNIQYAWPKCVQHIHALDVSNISKCMYPTYPWARCAQHIHGLESHLDTFGNRPLKNHIPNHWKCILYTRDYYLWILGGVGIISVTLHIFVFQNFLKL